MFDWIKTYALVIVGTLLGVALVSIVVLGWLLHSANKENVELTTKLRIVEAMGKQQEVKIVEAKQIEEKIQVVYRDKIKVVKEYVYDENKSDCANGIAVMRTVF